MKQRFPKYDQLAIGVRQGKGKEVHLMQQKKEVKVGRSDGNSEEDVECDDKEEEEQEGVSFSTTCSF